MLQHSFANTSIYNGHLNLIYKIIECFLEPLPSNRALWFTLSWKLLMYAYFIIPIHINAHKVYKHYPRIYWTLARSATHGGIGHCHFLLRTHALGTGNFCYVFRNWTLALSAKYTGIGYWQILLRAQILDTDTSCYISMYWTLAHTFLYECAL